MFRSAFPRREERRGASLGLAPRRGARLSVRGLTVRYGPIVAVRDLSLDVAEGEIVALLGANGAGKSSTLGAIAGLVRERSGEVELDGDDVSSLAAEALARRGVSLTPEGRRLFPRLTVEENLRLGAAAGGDAPRERAALRDELLELFPVVRERLASPAGGLSGGEQQQVALARSLMGRPRLLLLDEPTLGLAPLLVRRVFELVRRLRDERGLSIVLVEQNAHRALDVCDRAYVLRTGVVELSGAPGEVRRAERLRDAYIGVA